MTTIEYLYTIYLKHLVICTDTRKISSGCLFFALRGENFDANTFAAQAISLGAAFAVIDNKDFAKNEQYILVEDVLTTLQDLAKHHRKQLSIPIIGLTGSNGKTTTKELIKAVLAEKYKTFATKGNLNNHIGVPLSILSIHSDVEIAVIEMGANHQKEIEFLCGVAQPTHGLITNIGMAHLDGFGGFEGVKKGKAELFTFLKSHQGTTFIYRDNPYLIEMSQVANLSTVVYYGKERENTISGKLKHSDPLIEFEWATHEASYEARANITGAYNFENILAAVCIGHFFELTPLQINTGLAKYYPNNNRSQLTKTEHNTIICDFYNANPSSMTAALNNLKLLNAAEKIAIIGDMFELGDEANNQHEYIVQLATINAIETLFIGSCFYEFKDKYPGNYFITPIEAAQYLNKNRIKGKLVLLKGSRGMALEQLLPLL